MEFTEKLKELIKNGATVADVASAFGLDMSTLPPEWFMFMSNMIMFSFSMMSMMEGMDSNITGLKDQVSGLTSAVTSLQSELRERSTKNSLNSSMPPSREGYAKPNANKNTSLRETSGKKPGAQPGHKGNGLKKVMADETVRHDHYPKQCLGCSNLTSCISLMKCISSGHVYETKTVLVDNEHKVYSIVCPVMGELIKGEKPEEVKSTQQYGLTFKIGRASCRERV